ncbi:hypothetical protein GMSM_46370 [Geomonas sp. Red276]
MTKRTKWQLVVGIFCGLMAVTILTPSGFATAADAAPAAAPAAHAKEMERDHQRGWHVSFDRVLRWMTGEDADDEFGVGCPGKDKVKKAEKKEEALAAPAAPAAK